MITAVDGCTGIPDVIIEISSRLIQGGDIGLARKAGGNKKPPTEAGGSYLKLREQN